MKKELRNQLKLSERLSLPVARFYARILSSASSNVIPIPKGKPQSRINSYLKKLEGTVAFNNNFRITLLSIRENNIIIPERIFELFKSCNCKEDFIYLLTGKIPKTEVIEDFKLSHKLTLPQAKFYIRLASIILEKGYLDLTLSKYRVTKLFYSRWSRRFYERIEKYINFLKSVKILSTNEPLLLVDGNKILLPEGVANFFIREKCITKILNTLTRR